MLLVLNVGKYEFHPFWGSKLVGIIMFHRETYTGLR